MADWLLPTEASQYLDVLQQLKERDVDNATMFVSNPINPVTGTLRFVRGAQFILQEYDGAIWNDKILSVASGGTGSTNLDDVKASLNLGTMSNQNYDNVNITGGNINVAAVTSTVMEIKKATPYLAFFDTAGAVDSRRWQIHVAGNTLSLTLTNDANSLGGGVINIARSGNTATSMQIFPQVGIGTAIFTDTNSSLQIGGSNFVTIQGTGGGFAGNFYFGGGTWRHFTNGYGAMIRIGATDGVEFWTTTNNAGGAGALASISNPLNVSNTAFTVNVNATFGGLVTMNSSLSVAGSISGTRITAKADSGAFAMVIQGRVGDDYGLLVWQNSDGTVSFGDIRSRLAGVLTINFSNGYTFDGNFYPHNQDIAQCGLWGNRWQFVNSYWHSSPTNGGFIFDQNGAEGMVRVGRGLELRDPAGLYLMSGGIEVLNSTVYAPYGQWALRATHIIPLGHQDRHCGVDVARWLSVHSYYVNYTVLTQISDINQKKDIKSESLGLSFINNLKPVQYRYKDDNINDGVRHGLIAQDVERLLDDLKIKFGGLQLPNEISNSYGMNYIEFIGPIIKAIQELSRKVDEYGSRNDS